MSLEVISADALAFEFSRQAAIPYLTMFSILFFALQPDCFR